MGTVSVQGVNKAYLRYTSRWRRLLGAMRMPGAGKPLEHWVLRGVSFEILPGEAVGLIGDNGAGKSTLLKIIVGTTRATSGTVSVEGRVAALLELGMGFHPDFTGRENVFMGGQLLGMSDSEIRERMADIESFAEIGDYIDEPVRTYSSGMQVRLAFSLATCVRPDILIVDEALSVGDLYFQHKSFDRIRRFKEAGTTLLFVSHSPGTVKSICDRAILLDKGVVVRDGDPESVLDYYNAAIARQGAEYAIREVETAADGRRTVRSGSFAAKITGIETLLAGEPARAFVAGSPMTVRVEVEVGRTIDELTIGFLIRDRLGNDVFGTNTFHLGQTMRGLRSGSTPSFDFDIRELDLGPGSYSVTVALHEGDSHVTANFDWWDRAMVFQVIPGDGPSHIGVSRLKVTGRWISSEASGS